MRPLCRETGNLAKPNQRWIMPTSPIFLCNFRQYEQRRLISYQIEASPDRMHLRARSGSAYKEQEQARPGAADHEEDYGEFVREGGQRWAARAFRQGQVVGGQYTQRVAGQDQ